MCKRCHDNKKCKKDYDVIVVGAGTAGAAVAKYVSDAGHSVLVLEQGENQNENITVKYPNGGLLGGNNGDPDNKYGFVNKDFINLIQATFDPRTSDSVPGADVKGELDQNNQTRSVMHGGRNWGGASSHNYLSAYRTTSQFDQKIADEYVAPEFQFRWQSNVMTGIKNEIETYVSGTGVVGAGGRGTSGPVKITQAPDDNPEYLIKISDFLVDPVVNGVDTAASCPQIEDINQIGTTTVRVQKLNQFLKEQLVTPGFERERSHSGNAFLGPDVVDQETGKGVDGRKLKVVSKAFVNKIHFDCHNRAKKVEAIVNGKTKCYRAGKKVVIAAGALRSPGILERSGVGDASILTPMGIQMVYHNPLVGANYANQCATTTFGKINDELAVPLGQEAAALSYPGGSPNGLDRYGVHRWIGGGLSAFEPYFPTNGWMEQLGGNYGAGPDIANFLAAASTTTSFAYNMQPTSRGTCHITNSDPFTPPTLLRNFFTTEEDVDYGIKWLQFSKRLEQKLASDYPQLQYELIFPPTDIDYQDVEVLRPWAATLNYPTDHSMSTCKMGTSSATGVVDGNLHVFGVKDLMVADSSIWPIPPDCSTADAAVMIGRQASLILLSQL